MLRHYTTGRQVATQFPGQRYMDDLTTERSFESQDTLVIDVLGLVLDMLSMGAFLKPGTGRRLVIPGVHPTGMSYLYDGCPLLWCMTLLIGKTPALH